ncbi:hypothetical protein [Actinorugispora endophytica]|uniref:Uncharacterized protein n=1 Tax=Actinorugispora endophytica TaxID=1605990 RepID=A0A4R6UZH5_9ACTN|nr:hypothetical protein [Actinorugispora endophytica]TDQ51423.1 hypothetical protein EV190_11127 [Actinorugispora endophytica]
MDSKKLDEIAEYYDTHDISEEIENAELERHDPVPADEVMIVSSIRLAKPTMDRVREVAAELGVKPTALMRTWIEDRLASGEALTPTAPVMAAWSKVVHEAVREELREAGLRVS